MLDDLSTAQLQQQAIEKEILHQSTRVNAATAELEMLRSNSLDMKHQLEKEARDAEDALVDLRHRLERCQTELASAHVEVSETLEISRRKAERAAAFK